MASSAWRYSISFIGLPSRLTYCDRVPGVFHTSSTQACRAKSCGGCRRAAIAAARSVSGREESHSSRPAARDQAGHRQRTAGASHHAGLYQTRNRFIPLPGATGDIPHTFAILLFCRVPGVFAVNFLPGSRNWPDLDASRSNGKGCAGAAHLTPDSDRRISEHHTPAAVSSADSWRVQSGMPQSPSSAETTLISGCLSRPRRPEK